VHKPRMGCGASMSQDQEMLKGAGDPLHVAGMLEAPMSTHPNSPTAPMSVKSAAGNISETSSGTARKQNSADMFSCATTFSKYKKHGTNLLMMQIGMFRLLQGAAFRAHTPQAATNPNTGELIPYTFPNFVAFVRETVELWKTLIQMPGQPWYINSMSMLRANNLDILVKSVEDEFERVKSRIAEWQNVEAENEIEDLLGQKTKEEETTRPDLSSNESASGDDAVLKTSSRVIMQDMDEHMNGAMVPLSFWYDDFMPKLLDACDFKLTATKEGMEDLSQLAHNGTDAEKWFASTEENGDFSKFGQDVQRAWPSLTPEKKTMMRQAWRLTGHYLNGVHKMRECDHGECTHITNKNEWEVRHSGNLSNYVCFIDVHLGMGRLDPEQMRMSFPYYLSTPTWRFLHTIPEIAESKWQVNGDLSIITAFRTWILRFAKMYPCKHCLHHLHCIDVPNAEIYKWPLEYLLLGWTADCENTGKFPMSLEKKLETVQDPSTLRMFLWKLHNAISSVSCPKPEDNPDDVPYTQRFWPSLDSELAVRKVRNKEMDKHIPTVRLQQVYAITKVSIQLSLMHENIAIAKDDLQARVGQIARVLALIKQQEMTIDSCQFLQEMYRFAPDIAEMAPRFTAEEEEFARNPFFDTTLM